MASKHAPLFHPATIIATFFWTGKFPIAPGTAGSAATLPLVGLIAYFSNNTSVFVITIIAASILSFILGIWASERYMHYTGTHDPGSIVIDEVVGQLITFLPLPLILTQCDDCSIGCYAVIGVIGFLLFRLFDIWKPFPIGYLDKNTKGAFGVMIDDVLAGIYACVMLFVIHKSGAIVAICSQIPF